MWTSAYIDSNRYVILSSILQVIAVFLEILHLTVNLLFYNIRKSNNKFHSFILLNNTDIVIV